MADWSVRGRRYEVVIASDVDRDGIGVEVYDKEAADGPLFGVFHHDPSSSRTLTVWTDEGLPVELVVQHCNWLTTASLAGRLVRKVALRRGRERHLPAMPTGV